MVPVLVQSLRTIPSHLTNTQMFLNRLRDTYIGSSCIMEFFDVSKLYINVPNQAAVQPFSNFSLKTRNINLHEPSTLDYGPSWTFYPQIMVLLKACLDGNMFKWSGNHFAQVGDLRMGQRFTPLSPFHAKIGAPLISSPGRIPPRNGYHS